MGKKVNLLFLLVILFWGPPKRVQAGEFILGFQYLYDFFLYDKALYGMSDPLSVDGSSFGVSLGHKIGSNTFEVFSKFGKWTSMFLYQDVKNELIVTDWIAGLGFRQEVFVKTLYFKLGFSMHDLRAKLNGKGGPSGDSFTEDVFKKLDGKRFAPYAGFGVMNEFIPKFPFMFDFNIYKFSNETIYEIEIGLHIRY